MWDSFVPLHVCPAIAEGLTLWYVLFAYFTLGMVPLCQNHLLDSVDLRTMVHLFHHAATDSDGFSSCLYTALLMLAAV